MSTPEISKKPQSKSDARVDPVGFQTALASWFRRVAEDYPWRRTRDPYAVLVSELMLQQTRVETVVGRRYFERWMEQFPDVETLARAETDEVLKAWEGLGYYRRARNLKRAAETIVAEHAGFFPRAPGEILALPGVGRYTAGAVASLALDLPEPVVDANVARVFSRLLDLREEIDTASGMRELWDLAEALVPEIGAREHNSGLMELGQKICTGRKPRCGDCPVSAWCLCRVPEELPLRKPRRQVEEVAESVFLARRSDGSVLVARETGDRRTGLFRLPHTGEDSVGWPVLSVTSYSITRYRVRLTCLAAPEGYEPVASEGEVRWVSLDEIGEIAMAAPYRKVVGGLL